MKFRPLHDRLLVRRVALLDPTQVGAGLTVFVAVEAGVDRYGHETGMPDGEQRLEVLGPVAHHDRDAVTG